MTFGEFRVSAHEYRRGYEELLRQELDEGMRKAVKHCYRNWLGFTILAALRESKLRDKPLHYKVVKEFVRGFSTDDADVYIVTDTFIRTSSDLGINIGHGAYERFYIGWKDDGNRVDWEEMDNVVADIVAPEDIGPMYRRQVERDEAYRRAIKELKEGYEKSRKDEPTLTPYIWLDVRR